MSGSWGRATVAVAMAVAVLGPPQVAEAGGGRGPQARGAIEVTFLTTPEGASLEEALEVNERGQVVASLVHEGRREPVIWHRGAVTRLSPPEVPAANVFDISDRGQVVGAQSLRPWEWTPFSWTPEGGWRTLPTEMRDGMATDVNQRGQVLGMQMESIDLPPQEAVAWEGGELITGRPGLVMTKGALPGDDSLNERGQAAVTRALPGGTRVAAIWQIGGGVRDLGTLGGRSMAFAINERGDVVGDSVTADGTTHAFLWRDGEMIDLGTLGGPYSRAVAINERGDVVGHSDTADGTTHAFLWRDGEMIDLGTLGGPHSRAFNLNDRGQVVGTSGTPDGQQHAFVWQGGRMVDLGARVGGEMSRVRDLNERGEVVGMVYDDTEGSRAVLWRVRPPR